MPQVKIRPNTYYELTDGCEVTFADIKCQYFLGPPPAEDGGGTEDVGAEGGTCEATQAYHFAEGEGEGEADQLDGEGELWFLYVKALYHMAGFVLVMTPYHTK